MHTETLDPKTQRVGDFKEYVCTPLLLLISYLEH